MSILSNNQNYSHKKIKGRGIPLPLYFDLCFLNNYLFAVIITALGAKSVSSLVLTAV